MNFEIKIYRHIWKIYAESLNPNNNKIVPLHIFQKSAPAEIHITIFWVNIVPAIAFKFNIVREGELPYACYPLSWAQMITEGVKFGFIAQNKE